MKRETFNKLHSLIIDEKINDDCHHHQSWKNAQDCIAQELLSFPSKKLNDDDEFTAKTLKKFADTILWRHLVSEPPDLRRFLEGKVTFSHLKNHNIEAHLEYAQKIWDEFQMFSLCADLCSSSKTGDIFVFHKSGLIFPIEVKAGDVNRRILDALKEKNEGYEASYQKLKGDTRYSKQLERIERQSERHTHETSLYFTNESNKFGGKFKIYLKNLENYFFHEKMDAIVEKAMINGTHFQEIDDCLAVAAINSENSTDILEKNIKKELHSWCEFYSISAKEDALTMPLMLLNMQNDRKFHLVSGNCLITFFFYPTIFCKQYTSQDCRFEYKNSQKKGKFRDSNKQYIQISISDDKTIPFGPGLYQRLFSFLTTPNSIAKQAKFLAEEYFKSGGQSFF